MRRCRSCGVLTALCELCRQMRLRHRGSSMERCIPSLYCVSADTRCSDRPILHRAPVSVFKLRLESLTVLFLWKRSKKKQFHLPPLQTAQMCPKVFKINQFIIYESCFLYISTHLKEEKLHFGWKLHNTVSERFSSMLKWIQWNTNCIHACRRHTSGNSDANVCSSTAFTHYQALPSSLCLGPQVVSEEKRFMWPPPYVGWPSPTLQFWLVCP